MGKKEVRFHPFDIIINCAGFILGFFLTDFLIPIVNAVVSFISGGGEFPTQSLLGPVANMSGPLALVIIGLLGIMTLLFLKKVLGFATWVFFGLLLHGLLLAIGIPIPSILDIVTYTRSNIIGGNLI
jgi:hypothetical protein